MFHALPAAVRGILWMMMSALCFAATVGIIRQLSATFSIFEIVLFRQALGAILMLPWLARAGIGALRTQRYIAYSFRTLGSYGGMLAWYMAITMMPLADASALHFTLPLFAIILAVVFLKEAAGVHRWVATCVGFVGALVVIRPGFAEVNPAAFLVLCSATLYAATNITTKALAGTESTSANVFYGFLLTVPIAVIPAAMAWTTPTLTEAPLILGFGVCSLGAQWFLTRAYRVADASVLTAVDFLKLPFVAAIGFYLFSEIPDAWTWAGAAIIFSATYYVARREASLARPGGARATKAAAEKV